MARKGWEQLSRDRRVKLERRGISRADYERGISLGERTYAERREHALRTYGMTPREITKLRKQYPERAREHDRIQRLAKTDPAAARREGRRAWERLSPEEKQQRFTVSFDDGERETINPLDYYH